MGHIDRDRLGFITGGLLLALALIRLLQAPARLYQITVLGSPLGLSLSETTVMLLIVAGMAATGMEVLVQAHPLARQGQLQRTIVFWITPSLLALALATWLSRIDDLGLWALALLASALLMPLAMVLEYASVSPQQRRQPWLQWSYSVLVHLAGLVLFAAIYEARLRGLVGGPLTFVAAALLATRLLWTLTDGARRALRYGAVAGLSLAQLIWVFNYWPLSGLQGGLVLMLAFYVIVGLLQQSLSGHLDRRVVLEYGGVGLMAMAAILWLVP